MWEEHDRFSDGNSLYGGEKDADAERTHVVDNTWCRHSNVPRAAAEGLHLFEDV